MAELVENALAFSPAQWAVEIAGHWRRDGGYTLAIIDAGEGMTPEALDQANRRLAGAESFTVAPSTYLGHYVAGNGGPPASGWSGPGRGGHGTVASIDMPPALLTKTPRPVPWDRGAPSSRAGHRWAKRGRLGPEHARRAVHAAPAGPGAGRQFWSEGSRQGRSRPRSGAPGTPAGRRGVTCRVVSGRWRPLR